MIRIPDSNRFCVGDVVEFKSVEEMIGEFGKNTDGNPRVQRGFNQSMQYLCGQVFTIRSINGDIVTSEEGIEFSPKLERRWIISLDMIKPYDPPVDPADMHEWEAILSDQS